MIRIRVVNQSDLDALSKALNTRLTKDTKSFDMDTKAQTFRAPTRAVLPLEQPWVKHWVGMPEFIQERKDPFACIEILNPNRKELVKLLSQPITDKTKSLWYPFKSHWGAQKLNYISNSHINPKHPIYIVSKGRWESRLTSKALERMGVPYNIVVEAQEYDHYAEVIDPKKILILPQEYLDRYDTCDDLGDSVSKGPGAARNFCWEHAKSQPNSSGWHWVMDDNLDDFHRLHLNNKVPIRTGAGFRACEDFVERYENVYIAGLNYYSFCKSTDRVPPYVTNTRIYSCLLIRNDIPYFWRGRYNEDTDLSLRVLKDGYCTIQFNAFLCGKVTTQRMRGGNTKEFYENEGTKPKSQMLANLHPDVAKVVWRFNRWHHHVNYKPFKANELIRKRDPIIDGGVNNYDMKLVRIPK